VLQRNYNGCCTVSRFFTICCDERLFFPIHRIAGATAVALHRHFARISKEAVDNV